jgi:hypothetical protein
MRHTGNTRPVSTRSHSPACAATGRQRRAQRLNASVILGHRGFDLDRGQKLLSPGVLRPA